MNEWIEWMNEWMCKCMNEYHIAHEWIDDVDNEWMNE